MVEEVKSKKDRLDEEKLMNAIHSQAKDGYYFEKAKEYKRHCEKLRQQKKRNKRTERIVCFSILAILFTYWLWILLVVIK